LSIVEQLTALLPSKGNLVGVDVGSSYLKVCELGGGPVGVPKLEKFSIVALTEAAIIEDEIQKDEEISTKLRKIIEDAGIKNHNCAFGLFGPNTLIKRLQVPAGTDEEIEDHILWESEQYIPFGADESEISHAVVGDGSSSSSKDVLLAAAREDTIRNYEDLLKSAGVFPRVIEVSAISLCNLFEVCYADNLKDYQRGTILIDFGAQKTTVIVYKNKGPIFSKEVPIGGVLITEEIQRQMGLSYSEAEDLKMFGDENGNLPEDILTIMERSQQELVEDVKKALNFFLTTDASDGMSGCFITGGNSRSPGLIDSLEGVLDMEVELFNPFRKIKPSGSFSNEELEKIAAQGCVALGLALRTAK
jgi:type IV pilus assembly protein PilM